MNRASSVLCNMKVLIKLKGKIYQTTVRNQHLFFFFFLLYACLFITQIKLTHFVIKKIQYTTGRKVKITARDMRDGCPNMSPSKNNLKNCMLLMFLHSYFDLPILSSSVSSTTCLQSSSQLTRPRPSLIIHCWDWYKPTCSLMWRQPVQAITKRPWSSRTHVPVTELLCRWNRDHHRCTWRSLVEKSSSSLWACCHELRIFFSHI